jgi:hypothetical protein
VRTAFLQALCLACLLSPAWAAPASPAAFEGLEAAGNGQSVHNAYLLAWASYYAYPSKVQDQPGTDLLEKFRHRFRGTGLDVVTFLDERTADSDTKALVLQGDPVVLVAFVGSEAGGLGSALRDGATSMRVGQVAMGRGLVHGGYRQALHSVYTPLHDVLRERMGEGQRLWLTGHSLGGALATLAAYRLQGDGIPIQGVVLFGSPKVGDPVWAEEFQERLGERVHAWATAQDPVPFSPPSLHGREYRRTGSQNLIAYDGRVQLDMEPEGSPAVDPMDHRIGIYVNFFYRALSDEQRRAVPPPPPVCGTAQKLVAVHPDDGYPICLHFTAPKIPRERCETKGGDVVQRWCALEVPGQRRYRARRLE